MPSLKEIKLRIKGVTNIKQITKAMEMVAVNRVRKSELRMVDARPYAENISKLLSRLSLAVEGKSKYFEVNENPKNIKVLLITSDRGLCGSYNANAIQKTVRFVKEKQGCDVNLYLLGKKGNLFFRNKDYKIDKLHPVNVEKLTSVDISALADELIAEFEEGKFDELFIVYTRFITLSKNVPTAMKLLPIERLDDEKTGEAQKTVDYIFEPSCDAILKSLIPKYILSQIYSTILESLTSESGARMVAMKAASENAEEIIGDLQKTYNRVRQEAITSELLEIISGAEALAQ
ncbi:MAG: ATP synthase F1 subunit gamma [Candidatus Anammoxibacter sp.]